MLALPDWYFSSLLEPLSEDPLSLVPAIGAVSFIVGTGLSIKQRNRGLWLFLLPFVFSEALVGVAGLFRGKVDQASATAIISVFVVAVTAFAVWSIWRLKGFRLSAVQLAVFSITYSLFGAFVASMSFSDSWL